MRALLHALPLALALSLAAPAPAWASKAADSEQSALPEIEETGITLFDSVFMKVKAIHDTVASVEGRLLTSQDRIAAAVGLPPGTDIRTSMWELKQKAGGPVNVEMREGKPYLTLGGSGSQEAQQAMAQVNQAAGELTQIVGDLKQLPPQVMELVNACKALPGQLNPTLLQEAGMQPMQLPKVAKTVGKNVKAAAATPARIEQLVKTTQSMITGIPEGLKATEAPVPGESAVAKSKPPKAPKAGGLDELPQTPVGHAVGTAWIAFNDAEVTHAVNVLGQADADLSRAVTVVGRDELVALYQTQALVFMVGGNPAAASAAAARALMVDPSAAPIKDLGPEYARLHKMMGKTGLVRNVRVDVQGAGRAWISGLEVQGNSQVQVPQGEHLVQVERSGQLVTRRLFIDDGFVLAL